MPAPASASGLDSFLRALMEAILLFLVAATPWVFGAVEAVFVWMLYSGIALLMLLWGARILVTRRLLWRNCSISFCLAGLFLMTLFQLVPLSEDQLQIISGESQRFRSELLPATPEIWQNETTPLSSIPPQTNTVSLYPEGTRNLLFQLLAIVLVYIIVRSTLTGPGTLQRFLWVIMLNGGALSILGLMQYLSGGSNQIVYWTFRTESEIFGPFICRNHFSFYMHICLGGAIGLLLTVVFSRFGGSGIDPVRLLQNPVALWSLAAIPAIIAANMCSLSRGGFVSMLVVFSVLPLLWFRYHRAGRISLVFMVGGLLTVLALVVVLLNTGSVRNRLATLTRGDYRGENRVQLWEGLLVGIRDYPVLGTGGGTLAFVEPRYRLGSFSSFANEYAHNELLEAALEGGAVRLLLTVLLMGMVLRIGLKAVRRNRDSSTGGLALGLFAGICGLMTHSLLDFGLHIPAIALLVTVATAHLAALADESEIVPKNLPIVPGIVTIPLVLILSMSGLLLAWEGWLGDHVERLRLMANFSGMQKTPDRYEKKVQYLEAAVRNRPGDVVLRQALGQAYLDVYRDQQSKEEALSQILYSVGILGESIPGGVPMTLVRVSSAKLAGREASRVWLTPEQNQRLRSAMQATLDARNLCPLLPQTHAMVAAFTNRFSHCESSLTHLGRAEKLIPLDEEIWFAVGFEELREGRIIRSVSSWRKCLEKSDRYLMPILDRVGRDLPEQTFRDEVLPDHAGMILQSADRLHPRKDDPQRKIYLARAAKLILAKPELTAREWHDLAIIQMNAGNPEAALKSFTEALEQEGTRIDWRLEYARLLLAQRKSREARRELLLIQGKQNSPEVRELLEIIRREME